MAKTPNNHKEFNPINLDFKGEIENKLITLRNRSTNQQRVQKTFAPKNQEIINNDKEKEIQDNENDPFPNLWCANTIDIRSKEKNKNENKEIINFSNLITNSSNVKNLKLKAKRCPSKISNENHNIIPYKSNKRLDQRNIMKTQLSNNEIRNICRKNPVIKAPESYFPLSPSKSRINTLMIENNMSLKINESEKQTPSNNNSKPFSVTHNLPKGHIIHLRINSNLFSNQDHFTKENSIVVNKSKGTYNQFVKASKPIEKTLKQVPNYDRKALLYSNVANGITENNLLYTKKQDNVRKPEIKKLNNFQRNNHINGGFISRE